MSTENQHVMDFPAGSVIFREGDAPDYGYVLLSGEVEISKGGDDKRVVLTTVVPNQMFGELALMEHTVRSATATTINGCKVLAVSHDQFTHRLNALDPFCRYWILYLSDRIRTLSKETGRSNSTGKRAR